MKIIIDECLPKRVTRFFPGHDVWTVPQIGLAGYHDRELLHELDRRGIDLFVTIDGNMEYQQQFAERTFGTIVIRAVSNRFADLEHMQGQLQDALSKVKPKRIIHIA
jgi:predicted nuclease of predicted toxin-antitoxin system